ncbi:MAG: acyl-ACP--UDP-N-acetylglucosamine O-acyltransferase [Candidatus Tectomicrobia bacterium]|uniref:Acyl-ACP--UDP-N-acetylglucosamine O-acyltransferase n=1 Tax=Tectimicrobiota bacterium TaxID=2528274 RepID=A0A932GRG4_UNCTE|nr:acyl-ACP--UDP-N-acetylglucosamine O-acyltransferase [Candidatus Tectomicrobia bacterium]
MAIHPTAVIHPSCEIGEDVSIGPYAVIGEGVRIGSGTRIGPHAVIEGYTEIDRDCLIGPGAVLGGPPQDVKYKGAPSCVKIGAGTMVREFATVHRASREGEATVVGERCFLMAYSHVGHDCQVGSDVVLTNYVGLSGFVTVEDGAILSGYAGVHQFNRIGCLAIIAGMSGVTKDVIPYIIAEGRPAVARGVNTIGLRRRQVPASVRQDIQRAYKILFLSGCNVSQALDRIRSEIELGEEIRHLLEFIEKSERGILSAGKQ